MRVSCRVFTVDFSPGTNRSVINFVRRVARYIDSRDGGLENVYIRRSVIEVRKLLDSLTPAAKMETP